MKERETEITIETYEVLVISRRGSLGQVWCENCGRHVVVISINDACASGLSVDSVERRAQTGRIHLLETVGGMPAICLNSLIQI